MNEITYSNVDHEACPEIVFFFLPRLPQMLVEYYYNLNV